MENGGHHVPEHEIESRYHLGFRNLNEHWEYFDELYVFETSAFKQEPQLIFSIMDEQIEYETSLPEYLNGLIPNMVK